MRGNPREPGRGDDHGVGYGKPLPDNQFKPGQSGNPKGRPIKQRTVHPKHVFASEPTARALQVEADRVISLMVGNKRTRMTVREAAVRTLGTNAIKGNRFAAKLFLDELTEAEALERTIVQAEIDAMERHKGQWAAESEYAELHGTPLPAPMPHPEDLHFDRTTNQIVVRGPKNAKEKKQWDKILMRRDTMIEQIGSYRRAAVRDPKNAAVWRDTIKEELVYLERYNSRLPPRYQLEVNDVFDEKGGRLKATNAEPVADQPLQDFD